jgi:hypothetical protein
MLRAARPFDQASKEESMRHLIAVPLCALILAGTLVGVAAAKDAATAEAKACKGVEKYEPVEPGTEFVVGDMVWVWTRVKNAADTKIKMVWKKDGQDNWTATLRIGSDNWPTNSRRKCSAGSWTVEVLAEDGTKLTEVSFTVKAP